ncbi:MAG: DNA-directed RNA polymerase subunit N [Candidatus Brockarchaeota archaeon]|nr:DNA-directed RNA polymerase subunit N [Candidatus Brockarchaeota archaeon]MBO3810220.1 DNA-directed RNA polymerase subunit N [Candidatus Brockarchaeota archaeon]
MMFPVRCFTCGKVIGHLWEEYQRRVASGEDPKQVLDSLNVTRICCRRMFISHVDYIDELLSYSRGLSLGEDYRQ